MGPTLWRLNKTGRLCESQTLLGLDQRKNESVKSSDFLLEFSANKILILKSRFILLMIFNWNL